ncbi:metallophosphoesterase [Qipengyuania aquimaris]|uniref:metallophosphoesterase n=1 Tax=Qipengyuania aquimaris TaxID=255984 RepID=UPI001C98B75C|nr:metallophosphoesterase [Qipengyuania aquimaris]MBY6129760.1 metallophosphoesterase [Qipengyuania aquimaris]
MRAILLFLAAIAALVAAPLHAQESEAAAARIVAVGDLHGDYEAWEDIARQAGLIDKEGRWSGTDTVLVQLGDITDRGPDSLRIIRHLQSLGTQAEAAGGSVTVLLGNHEAMNVIGDLRYVDPGEYEAFRDDSSEARREATWKANREALEAFYKDRQPELSSEDMRDMWFAETPLGMLEHRRAWRPGGELGSWAASLPAVVKVGRTLFVHGGLSEEMTREPIEMLNDRHEYALGSGEAIDRGILEAPLGPLWYRGNVRREEPAPEDPARLSREQELATVLTRYDADRLLVAHTPSVSGIVTDLGGRLIRVDTGISSHYGGPRSFLVIEADVLTAHEKDRDGTWKSRALDPEQGEPAR